MGQSFENNIGFGTTFSIKKRVLGQGKIRFGTTKRTGVGTKFSIKTLKLEIEKRIWNKVIFRKPKTEFGTTFFLINPNLDQVFYRKPDFGQSFEKNIGFETTFL